MGKSNDGVCVSLYSISFNHLEIQNEAERVRQDLLDAKCLQVEFTQCSFRWWVGLVDKAHPLGLYMCNEVVHSVCVCVVCVHMCARWGYLCVCVCADPEGNDPQ